MLKDKFTKLMQTLSMPCLKKDADGILEGDAGDLIEKHLLNELYKNENRDSKYHKKQT